MRSLPCAGIRPRLTYVAAWRANRSKTTSAHGALDANADPAAAISAVWDWWASDLYAVYRARCPQCGAWAVENRHAGDTASKLYSPWAKDRPAEIAAKWLRARVDETLKQVWWNTQAGLPYRVRAGKEVKLEVLAARAERWAGEVPARVKQVVASLMQPEAVYLR
ncbi:terminase gpA endonuclease subunit [Paraburkholderia sp. RAU6.4a]|uniref:terminase gpA endonuclease subunit n=1 Tax=Paraburkholderia sp. RAU6.4a TaxID=2991067 RepID=UPI003D25565C